MESLIEYSEGKIVTNKDFPPFFPRLRDRISSRGKAIPRGYLQRVNPILRSKVLRIQKVFVSCLLGLEFVNELISLKVQRPGVGGVREENLTLVKVQKLSVTRGGG